MPFPRALTCLWLALLPGILLALHLLPFSHAEGDFWENMQAALRTGHVPSIFLPGFYPFVCAWFYRPFGAGGVEVFQAALYLASAGCVLLILRRMVGPRSSATLAAGLIALDPDLLSSIPKLWDTEATACLLAALAAVSLALEPARRKLPTALLLGAVWGLGMAVRPNFVLLAVPIAWALFAARARLGAACAFGAAALALAAANTLAHGAFYFPQNGPYNLFAGANPYTRGALLSVFNAEPSIAPAMAAHGYPALNSYALALRPVYSRFALQFMAAHPFEWLGLAALKLGTLLRPDTKAHPLFSAWGLVKLLTSLAVPFWLAILLWVRGQGWTAKDTLIVLFAVFYILPFVLTNADPRFRPALDVLVLTHVASLILRRLGFGVRPADRRRAEQAVAAG